MTSNVNKCAKVYIDYRFVDGPYGGGNQFLKALKQVWEKKGYYAENIQEADIILINSINAYHTYKKMCKYKVLYPNKKMIHRIDGPIFLIRGFDRHIDKGIFTINHYLADGTIFQTKWNKNRCIDLGLLDDKPYDIIINGSNRNVFNEKIVDKVIIPGWDEKKIHIIATSWSNNINKGYEYYKYLDENLDTNKYQFVFVGNSLIEYKNSICIPPQDSMSLSKILKMCDIYVTASKNDPCSNSLIEAQNCGLPAAVLRDGGHPEIVEYGGECFETKAEMMEAIYTIAANIEAYKGKIIKRDIEDVAERYYQFCIRNFKHKPYMVVVKNCTITFIKITILELFAKLMRKKSGQ